VMRTDRATRLLGAKLGRTQTYASGSGGLTPAVNYNAVSDEQVPDGLLAPAGGRPAPIELHHRSSRSANAQGPTGTRAVAGARQTRRCSHCSIRPGTPGARKSAGPTTAYRDFTFQNTLAPTTGRGLRPWAADRGTANALSQPRTWRRVDVFRQSEPQLPAAQCGAFTSGASACSGN